MISVSLEYFTKKNHRKTKSNEEEEKTKNCTNVVSFHLSRNGNNDDDDDDDENENTRFVVNMLLLFLLILEKHFYDSFKSTLNINKNEEVMRVHVLRQQPSRLTRFKWTRELKIRIPIYKLAYTHRNNHARFTVHSTDRKIPFKDRFS